jgi:hypothetical protein
MDDRFVLNVEEGVDVLHRNPGESCNTDQADRKQTVDAATADAMLTSGAARPCGHCIGD